MVTKVENDDISQAAYQNGHHQDTVGFLKGEAAVRLTGLQKAYGSVVAIENLSLIVERGEFFALLGPSGCGKTTTLRAIAGLASLDAGTIEIMNRDVTDLAVHKRNIGMMFQNYALFPHFTVAENIAFGLKMRHVPKSEIDGRVRKALDLVQLSGVGERLPRQLSGGQQQRVAFARAIVIEPEVLLLDEPLSNLDAKLRKEMQVELRALQRRLGITAIYVTHDQEEALSLADRIAIMRNGRMTQCATPGAIYRNPASRFVAEFVGRVNLLRGVLSWENGRTFLTMNQGARIEMPGAMAHRGGQAGGPLNLVLRPEHVEIGPTGHRADGLRALGQIEQVVYTGALTRYIVTMSGGTKLLAEHLNAVGRTLYTEGAEVEIYVAPEAITTVPDD